MRLKVPPLASAPARTICLLILLLVAYGLRAGRLDYQSLWHDEVSGVVHSFQSLQAITLWTASSEPHPPLHYYMLHLWMLAAGSSEFSARYLSLIFGVLTVPAVYGLLRKLTTSGRALIGSAALTVSAFHIYYSQEARMHVQACFFCVAAAWALLVALDRRAVRLWVVYGLLAAISVYLFYYSGLVLLAINVPLLLRRKANVGWWLANGAVVAALVPWLVLVVRTTRRFVGEPIPSGVAASPLDVARAVAGYAFGLTVALPGSILPAALLLAALLVCAWRLFRRGEPADQMLVLWAFLPPVVSYLGTLAVVGSADLSPRLALISLPAWLGVITMGWPARWRLSRWAWAGVVVALGVPTVAALVANYEGVGGRDDYRDVFALIQRDALPDQALIYDVPDQASALDYYFSHPNLDTFGLPSVPSRVQTDAQLAQIAAGHTGVWALLYGEPRPWVENWLDRHLVAVSNRWYGPYVRLKRYAPAPLPAGQSLAGDMRVDASFGPLRLTQIGAGSSDALSFELVWQTAQTVPTDFVRSLQLFDETGRRVAQADGPPLDGAIPTSRWTPRQGYVESVALTPDQPLRPGLYDLRVGVYDSSGAAFSPQPVLRLVVTASRHRVAEAAVSNAGWAVQSVEYGTGRTGELLAQVSGTVQSTPTATYTWFVHLVDAQGRLIAQDDHPPIAATTSWRSGDRFSESFRLPASPQSGAALEIGAYDSASARVTFQLHQGQRVDHLTVPLS